MIPSMRVRLKTLGVPVVLVLVTACSGDATPVPISTASPTNTAVPTAFPTATPQPVPTSTPIPLSPTVAAAPKLVATAAPTTPTPTLLPTPTPIPPTFPGSEIMVPGPVNILGPEEIVFDWTTDRCEDSDIPDLSARAFRDADGNVQLIATHHVNRRMIGPALNSLQRDCRIIMDSDGDPDPSKYNDKEWLASVYTLDGNTIYALIHNEYQGHSHPGQCPSIDYFKCWYNAVTFGKSTDRGLTYFHEPAPDHSVAALPYPYEPDIGPMGIFTPSDIIRNKDDGYYYTVIRVNARGLQQRGHCIMRTQSFDDPASWRAWNGMGFTVRFINPYTKENFDPADHVCQPVSRNILPEAQGSITFNTYFDKFLFIGTGRHRDSAQNKYIFGIYYSLSDDLIHWSPKQLIMASQPCWMRTPTNDCVAYPSLIDPSDTSRNFEITGQQAYLYYTRWHAGTSLDRDLVRVPTEFTKFQTARFVWDATQGFEGWTGNFDAVNLGITEEGLEFDSVGKDPWITGPSVFYPEGENLRITIRMKSTADSAGQLFYGQSFSEGESTRFSIIPDNEWHTYVIDIPPQGDGTLLRLDPSTSLGHIVVAWISVESIMPTVSQ